MKIRLLSDLHTEFRLPYKTHAISEYRGEDVLVLAGDIASGSTNTMDVIKHFLKQGFPQIVYVAGNHEYYGGDYAEFNFKMQNKCLEFDNVHFLNPGSVTLDGVLFTGGTLWTNFADNPWSQSAAKRGINDFRVIKGFDVNECARTYYKHLDYIQDAYENRGSKKVVVVTHFLPARECIAQRFRGSNLLNDYFANDLGEYISTMSDTTWLFGHTHDSTNIVIGDTCVIANPHGYYGSGETEANGFDPFKTIEV
jgi:predicted phosphodiesterase